MSIDSIPSGASGGSIAPFTQPAAEPGAVARQAGPAGGGGTTLRSPSAVASAASVLRKPDVGYSAEEMRRNLTEAIDRLNDQMRQNSRDLAFRLDEKTDRTVITVRRTETGEVIRQIPSEEVLKIAYSIEDIKGLLFNEAT